MPELPDIEAYLEALRARVLGRPVVRVRLRSPFVVRTLEPPPRAIEGKEVAGLRRVGKRVVLEFPQALFFVIHLMKAGRLRWARPGAGLPGRMGLCAIDFEHGTLLLTEAGSKRRASIHVIRGEAALAEIDPGGIEVFGSAAEVFARALARHRHTLKRALTDPHIVSGIGSAYADEILLRARLSPMKRTDQLSREEALRLHAAVAEVLAEWRRRILEETGTGWPDVTAFRDGMAAHGRAGLPCPQCGAPIQRIVYRETETNYCAACQTDGVVLRDRALSRLLKDDWPRSLDEWEERLGR